MINHLYLLPGTMCDHRLWSAMSIEIEKLCPNHFEFHFLSIGTQTTIDGILQDIKQQLPNERITLLGFSLGGYLASAFSVKYPDLVEQLFVISNMPSALPEKEIKERSRTVAWIKEHGYKGIPQKRVLALLDKSAHENEKIIRLIKDMDNLLGQNTLMHQLMTTTKRENLFAKLSLLPFNKYFCVGQNDNLVSVNSLRELNELDKYMQLSIFENTGHMVPLEQPKQMAEWVIQIYRKNVQYCCNKTACN